MFARQPIKLVDCEAHGRESDSELFVVEGDSAAQAVTRIRNARFQAILPMQGKPMNALKAPEKGVRKNPFLHSLIQAVGTDIGTAFDLTRFRYQRIVLLFDPDADGIHCGTLALIFFYRWMRPLLDAGHLKIIRPPMMEIVADQLATPQLAYSEEEGERIRQSLAAEKYANIIKRRFRGLASFPSDILVKRCVHADTRHIFPLTSKDAESSIQLLSSLGSD